MFFFYFSKALIVFVVFERKQALNMSVLHVVVEQIRKDVGWHVLNLPGVYTSTRSGVG